MRVSRTNSRLRSSSTFAQLVVLAMFVAGCAQTADPDNTTTSTDAAGGGTLQPPVPPSTQPSFPRDEFTDLMSSATEELDQLWRDVFLTASIQGASEYAPPDAVLGYRAGDLPDTLCARSGGADRWRSNAAYCPSDARIVYDEDWMRSMADKFGDNAPVTVLAHEWGHHAQSTFGSAAFSLPNELQADCMAGMYISTSTLLPHDSLESETPAMMSALETFFSLGNTEYEESEWFVASEHGSPQQRGLATATGLLSNQETINPMASLASGLPFCYGYRDFIPVDTYEIGPYRYLKLPGQTASLSGPSIAFEPESRTGQNGSIVLFSWIEELPLGATSEQIQQLWTLDAYRGALPIGEPESLDANLATGTGVAQYFQLIPESEGQTLQSGFFSLVAPSTGEGGLLILVVRLEPAPAEADALGLAILEEQVITLYQVVNRLCGPDDSGDPTAANLSTVCMSSQ